MENMISLLSIIGKVFVFVGVYASLMLLWGVAANFVKAIFRIQDDTDDDEFWKISVVLAAVILTGIFGVLIISIT